MKKRNHLSEPSKSLYEWYSFFDDRGVERELIEEYVSYINPLLKKGVPIIFEIQHLSSLIGISLIELQKMIYSPSSFYRQFNIPKRNGGFRTITTPYPSLKKCQKWIYKNILQKQAVDIHAHGYVQSRSIFSNAISHVDKSNLIKIDIENFFPSLKINWVINFFKRLGYAHNVSFYLASLCCLNNSLPQGAVTSPYLSNLLVLTMDKEISKLAEMHGLNYSRYADDIFLSGAEISLDIYSQVKEIISHHGFKINLKKTRLLTEDKRKIVTGIAVHNNNMTLPRSKKKDLMNIIYHIKKYGYISHISKMKIKNPYYIDSLIGKFNFWKQIEPSNEFVRECLRYLNTIKNQY